uniref:Uncharacterized protein n=1 Tax=Eutreptiella gymnastica TaxID=73025 RepID=A0A7S1I5Q8_9EUGL|mmetsp:Transcript_132122/g.229043  ORF Transcript_132122/g.229043 Transcript_132122/m.229043 type:complete len:338 (+) Transcript_132122:118-1131(+)
MGAACCCVSHEQPDGDGEHSVHSQESLKSQAKVDAYMQGIAFMPSATHVKERAGNAAKAHTGGPRSPVGQARGRWHRGRPAQWGPSQPAHAMLARNGELPTALSSERIHTSRPSSMSSTQCIGPAPTPSRHHSGSHATNYRLPTPERLAPGWGGRAEPAIRRQSPVLDDKPPTQPPAFPQDGHQVPDDSTHMIPLPESRPSPSPATRRASQHPLDLDTICMSQPCCPPLDLDATKSPSSHWASSHSSMSPLFDGGRSHSPASSYAMTPPYAARSPGSFSSPRRQSQPHSPQSWSSTRPLRPTGSPRSPMRSTSRLRATSFPFRPCTETSETLHPRIS